MTAPSGRSKVRLRLLQLLALPLLGLAAPAAHAEAGFTTPFDPEHWLVVNTTGGLVDETLAYSAFMCSGSGVESPGSNEVACIAAYTPTGDTNDVNLVGSTAGFSGGGTSDTVRSSTLVFTNTYWRPYLVSFNWSFTAGDLISDPGANQNVSFLVNPGFISPNGTSGNTYSYTSDYGTLYQDVGSIAYVPPGATLSFSINTLDNTGDPGVLTIKGFTTTEVPAPLPITGSGAILLYSRRLRRRTQRASTQPPALHPTTGKVLSLAQQRSSHQKQRALSHYGTMLGGPVLSVLPTSLPTHNG